MFGDVSQLFFAECPASAPRDCVYWQSVAFCYSQPEGANMRIAVALTFVFVASIVWADTPVRGHINKSGTYVAPHVRTTPNATRTDNYTSKPNTNPYTGRQGTRDPFAPKPPKSPYNRQ